MRRMGAASENAFATVGKRFRPDQMLPSEGAFIVQHAIDMKSGAEAVLKRPQQPGNQRSLLSLSVEATALHRISHPGIPGLLGAALDSGDPYIAMEFMHGVRYNLNNILDDRVACVVRLTISACFALSEAHKEGIIHRDICPANLVMDQSREALKVIDFGVAYVPLMPDLGADRLVGRPDFMAPEQVPGGRVDGRTDIYSLGVVAYMYLSGHAPYVTRTDSASEILAAHRAKDPIPLSAFAPWLPRGLQDAVMRSIARRPGERFADAREFAGALCHCLEGIEHAW